MYALNENGYIVMIGSNNNHSVKPCTIKRISNTCFDPLYVLSIKNDNKQILRQYTEAELNELYRTDFDEAYNIMLSSKVERQHEILKPYFKDKKINSVQLLSDLLQKVYEHTKKGYIPQEYISDLPHLINFYCTNNYNFVEKQSLEKAIEIPDFIKKIKDSQALLTPRKIYKKPIKSLTYMNAVCFKFYRFYDRYSENPKYIDKYPVYFINPLNNFELETCKIDGFIVPSIKEMQKQKETYYIRIKFNNQYGTQHITLSNDDFYHYLFENAADALLEQSHLKDSAMRAFEHAVSQIKDAIDPAYKDDIVSVYALFMLTLFQAQIRVSKTKINYLTEFYMSVMQNSIKFLTSSVS